MAARRCSTCSRNYALHVWECPACGTKTWPLQEENPDTEATPAQASADYEFVLGSVDARIYDPAADRKIVSWRATCFERLGFTVTQAAALALRRDVDREKVEAMLGAGARPLQVVAILL